MVSMSLDRRWKTMANKARALALDLMNHQLKGKDIARGFTMRIVYTPKLFARQFYILGWEGGIDTKLYFRHLEDAIACVREIDKMCERSRKEAVRQATTR
jgi:hypothetical protein